LAHDCHYSRAPQEYQSAIDIAAEALRQLTPDVTTVDIQKRMHVYHRLHNIHGSVFKLALDVGLKKADGSAVAGQRCVVVLGSWVPHQPRCEAFGGGCGRLLAGDAESSRARPTTLGFRFAGLRILQCWLFGV
jgi:hypothetical protein